MAEVLFNEIDADAYFNAVSPAFFHTMGIPMVSGREFTRDASDRIGRNAAAIGDGLGCVLRIEVALGEQVEHGSGATSAGQFEFSRDRWRSAGGFGAREPTEIAVPALRAAFAVAHE